MEHQEILERPGKILSRAAREKYFQRGYVGVEGLVDEAWLSRMRSVTAEFVQLSRNLDASGRVVQEQAGLELGAKDKRFDLEPDHCAAEPRIRRLNSPVDYHAEYWAFASLGPFAEVAEDLLGPNVKFHHAKLNFKWGGGGEEVKWHQDIQFWPHTNYDVLTIGVYLEDVTEEMAPMGVIPGSHDGPLYDLYGHDGQWTGNIRDDDIPNVETDKAEYLGGCAGSITVHNCRSVHGSPPNMSQQPRPLLLCAYSCADAIPITGLTSGGLHAEAFVRGEPAKWARFDPRPVLMPPDWSKVGYKSIFEHQQSDAQV